MCHVMLSQLTNGGPVFTSWDFLASFPVLENDDPPGCSASVEVLCAATWRPGLAAGFSAGICCCICNWLLNPSNICDGCCNCIIALICSLEGQSEPKYAHCQVSKMSTIARNLLRSVDWSVVKIDCRTLNRRFSSVSSHFCSSAAKLASLLFATSSLYRVCYICINALAGQFPLPDMSGCPLLVAIRGTSLSQKAICDGDSLWWNTLISHDA